MQGRKYETTGNARKGIGDAAWYASLIVFLVMVFIVASVAALLPAGTVDHDAGYLASELELEESSNGQVTVISYVDADGAVVNAIDMGYAAVRRTLNADGMFYFDAQNRPVPAALGQYGEAYQRDGNGRIVQTTYLDVEGNAALTNAGYAIARYTYHRDGAIDTSRYFDAEDRPVALSKGQYGIRSRGNVNLLLDQNGHAMLCVDNLLNGFPYMVVVFGCLLCLLLILLPGRIKIVLMLAYVLFIFYETLMFREAGEARTNLSCFPMRTDFSPSRLSGQV